MFERYTEKARRVIFFARYQASQFGSPYIETEHLLLGLMQEDRKLVQLVLKSEEKIAALRERLGDQPSRERLSTSVDLPLSTPSKRVLAYGAEEAERMRHANITTGHLLLGLLREEEGLAAKALHAQGVALDDTRAIIAEIPPGETSSGAPQPIPAPSQEYLRHLADRIPEERRLQAARLLRALADDKISVAAVGSSGAFSFSFSAYPALSAASSATDDPLARFTEKARRVLFFARYEAGATVSPEIEPEHLLLGVFREEKRIGGIQWPFEKIRDEIVQAGKRSEQRSALVDLPLSEGLKAALDLAGQEADSLGHRHVACEHLVLGLIRRPESLAAQILQRHGLDIDKLRKEIRER